MWLLVLLIVLCPPIINCACFFGKGPRFSKIEGPTIEQLAINLVNVTWVKIINNTECVDQYVIKYWPYDAPRVWAGHYVKWRALKEWNITEYLKNDQFSHTIELKPKILYEIKVLAREDHGVFGHSYYPSRIVQFKTKTKTKKIIKKLKKKQKPLCNLKSVYDGNDFPFDIRLLCLCIVLVIIGAGIIIGNLYLFCKKK